MLSGVNKDPLYRKRVEGGRHQRLHHGSLRALGARDIEQEERKTNKGFAGKWPVIISIFAIYFNFRALKLFFYLKTSITPRCKAVMK